MTTFALCMVLLTCGNIVVNGNETISKNFQELLNAKVNHDAENHTRYRSVLTWGINEENEEFNRAKDAIGAARLTRWPATLLETGKKRRDTNAATNSAPDDELTRFYKEEKAVLQLKEMGTTDSEKRKQDLIEELAICKAQKSRLERQFGKIEEKKDNIEFTLKVPLTARTRIEVVIRDNFPENMRKPDSIQECIVIILKSGAPSIRYLYNEVLRLYGAKDVEKSIRTFAVALERIFGAASGLAAHNIMDSRLMELFRSGPEKLIKEFLDFCKVPHDEDYVKALRAISLERPTAKDDDMYEGTLHTYNCVEIKPSTKKESTVAILDKGIEDTDVQAFFPTTGSKIKDMQYIRTKDQSILSIVVEFESTNVAVVAFNENHGWLKQRKVATRIISCPTSESGSQQAGDQQP